MNIAALVKAIKRTPLYHIT